MEISLITQVLLLAFVIAIIILIYVDIKHLKSLKKAITIETEGVSPDKYYELKWRINLILSVTTIVGIIIGFLGISLNNSISNDYEKLKNNVTEISDSLEIRQTAIKMLSEQLLETSQEAIDSKKKLSQINNAIKQIQTNNIQKWEFQFFEDVPTNLNYDRLTDTIYFNRLRTADGRKIPKFNTIPLVNLIDNEKTNWLLKHIDTSPEYFIIKQSGSVDIDYQLTKIDIWIMYK